MNRLAAVLVAGAALLGGCATPTNYEAMVPTSMVPAKRHAQSVAVSVSGGQETDSAGKPQISDDAFRQALTEAINRSRTFSRVVAGSGGDYVLTVALFGLDQPSFGFSFTVKMEAGWTLRRASGGAPVWQESIRSQFTASTSDAFAAVTRLRLATEGAARENIAQGLAKISRLDL
jgi:hypothetical protein